MTTYNATPVEMYTFRVNLNYRACSITNCTVNRVLYGPNALQTAWDEYRNFCTTQPHPADVPPCPAIGCPAPNIGPTGYSFLLREQLSYVSTVARPVHIRSIACNRHLDIVNRWLESGGPFSIAYEAPVDSVHPLVSCIAHDFIARNDARDPFSGLGALSETFMAAWYRTTDDDGDDGTMEAYCHITQGWVTEWTVLDGFPVANEHTFDCVHCGDTYLDTVTQYTEVNDRGVAIDQEPICNDCCEEHYHLIAHGAPNVDNACALASNARHVTHSDEWVTLVYGLEHCSTCNGCDETFYDEDQDYVNGEDGLCRSCYQGLESEDDDGNGRNSRYIKGRHSSDSTSLGWFVTAASCTQRPDRGITYLGIECEMEPNAGFNVHEVAESNFSTITHFCGFEEDGSLDAGVEAVFAPHTLEALQARMTGPDGKAWRQATRNLRAHETKTCGLHVHVSRANLDRAQIERILYFLELDSNQDFLNVVAQRKPNRWCQRAQSEDDRYRALNVTNKDTIEYRLFRGNTRPDRILKAAEFAHALTSYCHSYHKSNWRAFVSWLRNHATLYPNLLAYIDEKIPGAKDSAAPSVEINLDVAMANEASIEADPEYLPF